MIVWTPFPPWGTTCGGHHSEKCPHPLRQCVQSSRQSRWSGVGQGTTGERTKVCGAAPRGQVPSGGGGHRDGRQVEALHFVDILAATRAREAPPTLRRSTHLAVPHVACVLRQILRPLLIPTCRRLAKHGRGRCRTWRRLPRGVRLRRALEVLAF